MKSVKKIVFWAVQQEGIKSRISRHILFSTILLGVIYGYYPSGVNASSRRDDDCLPLLMVAGHRHESGDTAR
jgi:hypothetical protein